MRKFIQNGEGIFDVIENEEYLYYVNEVELRAMRRVLDDYKIKYVVNRKGYDKDGKLLDDGTEVEFN